VFYKKILEKIDLILFFLGLKILKIFDSSLFGILANINVFCFDPFPHFQLPGKII